MSSTVELLSRYKSSVLSDGSAEAKQYGVKGMKWGIRKDRNGKHRPTKEVLAEQKRNRKERRQERQERRAAKKENKKNFRVTFRQKNPPLQRPTRSLSDMSNQELNDLVNRLRLERQLSELTSVEKMPPSRVQRMLRDIPHDVIKGATTEVGKQALAQLLRTLYDNSVSAPYRIK